MAIREGNPLGPIISTNLAQRPSQNVRLVGQYVTIVKLSARHADAFYPQISGPENAHLWDYMFDGPYDDPEVFRARLGANEISHDPVFYAIVLNGNDDDIVGIASYLRIEPTHRSIEVGNLMYSAQLQRTPGATEAMYLMARYAFEDLGYRRYEWKCNALNAPSRRAALRLGFTFEGIFRKHLVVKGRNRDTSWYSMVDEEWPAIKRALEAWLDPTNFNGEGRQQKRLEEFR